MTLLLDFIHFSSTENVCLVERASNIRSFALKLNTEIVDFANRGANAARLKSEQTSILF
jgi:hypothetical protein